MAEFRLKGVFYGGSTGKLHHQGRRRRRDSIAFSFVQPPPPISPTLLLFLIKRHDASNLHITHFQSLRLLVHLAFHGDSVGEGGVAVPLPLSLGHTEGALPHLQRRWPRSQELIVDLTLDSLQLNTRWSLGHKNPLVVATEPEPPRTEFLHEATTRTSF